MGTHNKSIPSVSVDKAIEYLSESYCSVIMAGLSPKVLPSVMMWGPPGCGKSQAVRQIGKEIEARTGKKCKITDVRLLLFNPIDLRGIPTANEDKTLAVWLKPQIFNMDESKKVVNILFLDEISAAPQSVQAAAYQITLDRVIGEHKLPDNCIVIAAGNRTTDKAVAFKMPSALANRLCHLEIEGSVDSWRRWAVENGISDKVLGFLAFRPDYLMMHESGSDALAFATPRSWEMVSNILNTVNQDPKAVYPLVAGCVGAGVATEFVSYCKAYKSLPCVEDIFKGKYPPMPTDTDVLYALISAMTVYAREHKTNIKGIGNSIKYALQMPVDFSAALVKSYMAIEKDYKRVLMGIPEFAQFIRTKGKLLNGNIK